MVCDAVTGFPFFYEIYSGKSATNPEANKIHNLVQGLVSTFKGKGHTLYMDRYFTSSTLVKILYDKKINVVAAVQKNRKDLPSELEIKKLNKGENVSYRSVKRHKGHHYVYNCSSKQDDKNQWERAS